MIRNFRIAVLEQQGHLFNWVPVCLGGGIGTYFLLRFEPTVALLCLVMAIAAGAALIAHGRETDTAALVWCLTLVLTGFTLAGVRAQSVAAPVLGFRYYGPIEGRVVGLDRSASDAVRVTLTDVVLENVAPIRTPHKVRVSLHAREDGTAPKPGMIVGTTGHLSPPAGPVEPGGFDFQRHAWFQRLGAIGYSRTPLVTLSSTEGNATILALRMRLSKAIQTRMPPQVAGFAAAVTTGDRSAISQDVLESLRIANLAHLLAISGLHMGLLAAFVFGAVRVGVAVIPPLAVRINGKKAAAVVALAASAAYLVVSGGSVSTQRAFVMTAVMLTAILLDRRALSLRAVAVAATIVLTMRPEALLGPGFQMSFAATTALVAVFGGLRDREIPLGPKWFRPVSAVVVSSLVAGLATAPFAAMHFNHLAHYGLPANLMSVPVMGTIVVPAAVLAGVLSLLGLEAVPLWIMAQGLSWIQGVASFFSSLEGARSFVVTPGGWVLPLVAFGALWVILWRKPSRWGGVGCLVLAGVLWSQTERPDILISDTGGLVGLMTADGRALSKPRGNGFVARSWLENDGSARDQEDAASRWDASEKGMSVMPIVGQGRLIHLSGKRALSAFQGCHQGDILVTNQTSDIRWACQSFGPENLRVLGAVAIQISPSGPKVVSARQVSGRRLWHATLPHSDQ
ncbi:ComEC/Rec2 family competence protein [Shimia sp. Alg240-R146]|uniref:ComEC/Rec2 family competence protein n=1 Tax=Shimia sp. Alg240-R146 TaxID=2993449 RepID=UPI0022E89877|nr:ComEC/Rec2 family competence protein [Shimia sp. Alg240-R146]